MMKVSSEYSSKLLELVAFQLSFVTRNCEVDGLVGLTDLHDLKSLSVLNYFGVSFYPDARVKENDGNIFWLLKKRIRYYIIFETLDTVIQFLEQAASDPNVLATK